MYTYPKHRTTESDTADFSLAEAQVVIAVGVIRPRLILFLPLGQPNPNAVQNINSFPARPGPSGRQNHSADGEELGARDSRRLLLSMGAEGVFGKRA